MSDGTVSAVGEAGLIDLFVERRSPPSSVVVGNGDDAAVWTTDHCTVATTDSLVEGVHFERIFGRIEEVGRKLVTVNLSDIAAMGAEPRFALLSVFLRPDTPILSVESLAEGIRSELEAAGAYLIGGNVAETQGPMILQLTLIGEAKKEELMLRAKSAPGDAICVTGTLGDARGALEVVSSGRREEGFEGLLAALNDPDARTESGKILARTGKVKACCDVSDGLGRDLRRLLEPYSLGAEIDDLPLSDELVAFSGSRDTAERFALEGGEDYELLLTAAESDVAELQKAIEGTGVKLTRIGTVVAGKQFLLRGKEVPYGFEHFEEGRAR